MAKPMHVLLVDESPFFLTVQRQFLKHTQARVGEARSAAQALEICRRSPPDLVLIAFELPDMDGAAFCRTLQGDSRLAAIPVVVLCEQGRPEQLQACRTAGADALLTKPLERLSYLEVASRFLDDIKEPRQPFFLQVNYRLAAGNFTGKALDISSGGLFIASDQAVQEGAAVELDFVLPGDDVALLRCRGEVVWRNLPGQPFKLHYPQGFGVRFAELSAGTAQRLRGYLGRELRSA